MVSRKQATQNVPCVTLTKATVENGGGGLKDANVRITRGSSCQTQELVRFPFREGSSPNQQQTPFCLTISTNTDHEGGRLHVMSPADTKGNFQES